MKKTVFVVLFVFVLSCLASATAVIKYDTLTDWNTCSLTHADTYTSQGSVKIMHIIDDDFNTAGKNYYWLAINEEKGNWMSLSEQGLMRLSLFQVSEWWGSTDNTIKLAQQVDLKDNFEAQIHVSPPSSYGSAYDFHGIFLRQDSFNAIAGGYNQNAQADCWQTINKESTTYGTKIANFTGMTFKIINEYKGETNGSDVKVLYKKDSSTQWNLIKILSGIKYNPAQLGFYLKNTSVPFAYADFDNFVYYGSKTFTAAEIISKPINLNCVPAGTGTLRWEQNIPMYGNAKIDVYLRTSSDGENWPEDWGIAYSVKEGSTITAAKRQYIQFKAVLTTDDYQYTPELQRIEIEYPSLPPLKPVLSSTTNTENSWTNTKNAQVAFIGSDYNGVTVPAYFMSFNDAQYFPTTITTSPASITCVVEGENKIKLIAVADVSNDNLISEPGIFKFYVDTVNPGNVNITSSHRQFEAENSNNVRFDLTAVDPDFLLGKGSGIQGYSYTFTRNGDLPDNTVDSLDGKVVLSTVENGTWIFRGKAIDRAGNAGAVSDYTVKVDFKGKVLDDAYVKAYPTICSKSLNISYELAANTKSTEIQIKDSSGKNVDVFEGEKSSGKHIKDYNVNGFTNGVYFVRIICVKDDGMQDVVVKKIVVKKMK